MSSLKKLGIECSYDPHESEGLKYSVSIDQGRLRNPAQAREHFTRIINAISKDAANKGGLEHLTVCVDKEYFSNFQSVVKDLVTKSEKQEEMRYDSKEGPIVYKVLIIGGAVAGGIIGFLVGYNKMADWATDIANYMNNASHLWAPLTGLTQTGVSLVGTALATGVCAITGAVGGRIVSLPFVYISKTHLASNFSKYKSLESALAKAESTPKQEST